MTMHLALAVAALAASALLFFTANGRVLAAIALGASALEVVQVMGWLRVQVAGVDLALVLGLALALPGLFAWFRATAKTPASAAAIVAFVGLLQVTLSGRLLR